MDRVVTLLVLGVLDDQGIDALVQTAMSDACCGKVLQVLDLERAEHLDYRGISRLYRLRTWLRDHCEGDLVLAAAPAYVLAVVRAGTPIGFELLEAFPDAERAGFALRERAAGVLEAVGSGLGRPSGIS